MYLYFGIVFETFHLQKGQGLFDGDFAPLLICSSAQLHVLVFGNLGRGRKCMWMGDGAKLVGFSDGVEGRGSQEGRKGVNVLKPV